MAHKLPPLRFGYDALEPYIDAETMELHHDKHHKAYVDNLNKARSWLQARPGVPSTETAGGARQSVTGVPIL